MILYVIGIDCGVNTGLAIWDCTRKQLIEVSTYGAQQAWAVVRNLKHKYGTDALLIRFEDARLRTWFGKAGKEKLQGAGSIKRDSTLWEDFCQLEGLKYEAVAPKHNKTKLPADTFKMITKWPRLTSQHGRDAAMLVYQYSPLNTFR